MFVVVALLAAGVIGYLQLERSRTIEVPVLMYHKLGDVLEDRWTVPPDEFASHMQFLADHGYVSVLPSDLVAHRRWGKPLPAKPVVLTFDDGYVNNLTYAEPILARHGFRGVMYLPTEKVAVSEAERQVYEGEDILTWPEIRTMHERGTYVFGGHSHSHVNLATMRDPSEEIARCYEALVAQAGIEPDSMAYPYGQFSDDTSRRARHSMFTTAFSTRDEVAVMGRSTDLHALPRVSVMGGAHKYIFERLPSDGSRGDVAFRVRNPGGVKQEVCARLVVDGLPDEQQWLGPLTMRQRKTLSWRLPGDVFFDGKARVEIWDKNRVLRLYPLSTHDDA